MSLIKVEQGSDGVATLTLNRPEKLNALSKSLVEELISGVENLSARARACQVRALVLNSSAPKAFCVGADLDERRAMDAAAVGQILNLQRDLMDSVAAFPAPTFAILWGAAFGGGLELAMACDFRFASPAATMGLVETRLAIIPGAGGTQRLKQLVGATCAKALIFRGQKMTATAAQTIGLVDEVSDDPEALCLNWLADILDGAPLAILAAKDAIQNAPAGGLAAGLDWERRCYDRLIDTDDRLEGLAAFAEKRKAKFKGK